LTIEQRLAGHDEFDETRSVKSEFDYSTKKKFVEMISQQQRGANGLKQGFKLPDAESLKRLEEDRLTKRSHLSLRSTRQQALNLRASIEANNQDAI
jgi:hypothetical protein